jgi:hypothetical protein
MTRRYRQSTPLIVALFLFLLAGCGDSKPAAKMVPVSGTVKHDGKAMPEGQVAFKITQTGALHTLPVKDGEFKGEVPAGDYRVEVSAYTVKIEGSGAMKGEVKINTVAKQFNSESKLTATVKDPGPNQFSFDVTSK